MSWVRKMSMVAAAVVACAGGSTVEARLAANSSQSNRLAANRLATNGLVAYALAGDGAVESVIAIELADGTLIER